MVGTTWFDLLVTFAYCHGMLFCLVCYITRGRDLTIRGRPLGVTPALLETGNVSSDIQVQSDRIQTRRMFYIDAINVYLQRFKSKSCHI